MLHGHHHPCFCSHLPLGRGQEPRSCSHRSLHPLQVCQQCRLVHHVGSMCRGFPHSVARNWNESVCYDLYRCLNDWAFCRRFGRFPKYHPQIHPFISFQGSTDLRYPFIIFTGLGVIGIFMTSLVPETKDVPLPERNEDVDKMVKNFRYFEFRPWLREERNSGEEQIGLKRKE